MPRPIHNSASYLPALDGLRALAVVFVVLYHLDVPGFSGGLLGVGMFFTLSGFLITSLLISSHEKTGGLGLRTFWIRRFRRLVPAVVLVLAATLITAAIAVPDKFTGYLWESLTALFYVNNWYTIASSTSYFDRFGGPSPLGHLWSLSIEEQFYLLWPLILAGLYLVIKRRLGITLVIVGMALASFYLLYDLASPAFDNTRAYEGTDTRAGGLLLGAALAFWWPARKHRVTHTQRCWLDVAGLAGVAAIVYLVVTTNDNSMSLYSWGLLVLTLATMGILAAAVAPQTLVASILSLAPLRWIGERSYGLYLWHMPVVAFLPLAVRTDSPWFSALLVIAVTTLLASLSWRYVEDPIRRYGFVNALTGRHDTPEPAPPAAVAADPEPESVPATGWDAAAPLEPRPIVEHPVDLSAVLGRTDTDDKAAASPSLAMWVLNYPDDEQPHDEQPDDEQPDGEQTGEDQLGDDPAPDERLVVLIPDTRARRRTRRGWRSVGAVAGIVSLAVVMLVGANLLNPDMAMVRAFTTSAIDDEAADPTAAPTTEPVGPTLPAAQRRTRCTEVIHVGDSTSIGMEDPGMQPDPALRIGAQYQRVGAATYHSDIAGGRSSLERLDGEPNAVESIESDLARGWKGCWVMAKGINDTANVEVGGPGPVDMRIDRLMAPLKDQPVLWPTISTNRLNENPAYNNRAMQRFNRALIRACKRYPNLRVYDLSGEVDDSWFLDGVHFTPEGNAARANKLATALATLYPADDLAPQSCVLRSVDAVEPPAGEQK
ncbi:acyltransferase family protein [Gordonia phosphorivorans]|uniref:Acyltransferase family protein n=1 Tax=Gordonia phosphorivorans TaxID=1056982 RepID=A0ABV6H6M6_9ACTN